MVLIRQILQESASRRPDGIAIKAGDQMISYRLLAEQVARLAAGLLDCGLSPGDRIAVLLPNTVELVTTMLAASYAELIVVPLLADYPPPQNGDILSHTAARALVTSPTLLSAIPADSLQRLSTVVLTGEQTPGRVCYDGLIASAPRDIPHSETEIDPIGLIVYTSGSTGRPKGVAHTQARLVNRADLFISALALTADDATLTAHHLGRPLFFVANLLAMLRVGGCLALVDPPDIDWFWRVYDETQPTYYLSPPGYIYRLVESPSAALADHSRLKGWINVGDQSGVELQRRVATLTGRSFLNMFGMTETGFLAMTPPAVSVKPGSMGKPLSGVEMRLVDQNGREVDPGEVGRLRVRTPNMMVGYWNDTLQTHRVMGTGWFDTQDLMKVDEDGDYWFMGRGSEVIVRNGANVASALVIETLEAFWRRPEFHADQEQRERRAAGG